MSSNSNIEIGDGQVVEQSNEQNNTEYEENFEKKPFKVGISVNEDTMSDKTKPIYDESAFIYTEIKDDKLEEGWITFKQLWNRAVNEGPAVLTASDWLSGKIEEPKQYVHQFTQTLFNLTFAKCTQTEADIEPVLKAAPNIDKDVVKIEFLNRLKKKNRYFEDNILANTFNVYRKKSKKVLRFSCIEDFPKCSEDITDWPIMHYQYEKSIFKDTHVNEQTQARIGTRKWCFAKESTIFAPAVTDDSNILLFMLKAQRKHSNKSSHRYELPDSDGSLDADGPPTSHQGFWDLMASSTVQNAAPHCLLIGSVIIDKHGVLINGRMYLGEYNWHTLVPVVLPEGWHPCYSCAVCSAEVKGRDAIDHMQLASHKSKLAEATPLDKYGENIIRRITDNLFHCAVCNKIVQNVSKHVLEDMHKLQYEMAIESAHIYFKKKNSEANIATETNQEIETDSESEEKTDSGTDNETDNEFEDGSNSSSDNESDETNLENDNAMQISETSHLVISPTTSDIDPACKFIIEMPAVTTADLEMGDSIALNTINYLKDHNDGKEQLSSEEYKDAEENFDSKDSSGSEECNINEGSDCDDSFGHKECNPEEENFSEECNGDDTDSTQIVTDSEQDIIHESADGCPEPTKVELDLGLWPDLATKNCPEENNDIENMDSPKGFSYAQIASKKAQPVVSKLPPVVNKLQPAAMQELSGNIIKTNQECMVVTVGRNKYILNSDYFHCLLPCKETWYCMACKKNCSLYKNSHKFSEEHSVNIMQCPLIERFGENMIRKLDFKFFHCAVCNRLIFHYELDKHINEREHRALSQHIVNRSTKEQIEIQEQTDLETVRAVKRSTELMKAMNEAESVPDRLTKSVGTILLNVYGVELRIDRYAWQGIVCCSEDCYRCVLCCEVLQMAMIDDHLRKPNHVLMLHKVSFSAEYGEHLLRQVDPTWVHCAVCNKVITSGAEHVGIHIRGASHLNKVATAKMSAANRIRAHTPNGTAPVKPPDSPITRYSNENSNGTSKLQQLLLSGPETVKSKQPTTYYYSPGKISSPAKTTTVKKIPLLPQENTNSTSKMQLLPVKTINRNQSTDSDPTEPPAPESISDNVSVSRTPKVKSDKKVQSGKANQEPETPLKEYLITFGGRKVVLGGNAWHGIRECLSGVIRCYPCGISFECGTDEHLTSLGHRIAIAVTTLMDAFPEHFIRELSPSLANCIICNNLLPPADVDKHIVNPKHRKGLLAVTWDKHHERSVADAETINLDEGRSAVDEAAKQCCIVYSAEWALSVVVSARAWHGLHDARDSLKCFVCAASVPEAEAAEHAAGAEHVAAVRACRLLDAYPGHFLRKMPKGQVHCVTCHALVQTKDVDCHVLKENHLACLQRARVDESRLAELRSAEVVYFAEHSGQTDVPEKEKSAESEQKPVENPVDPEDAKRDSIEIGENVDAANSEKSLQSSQVRKDGTAEAKSELERARLAKASIDATLRQAKLARRGARAARAESEFAERVNALRACAVWSRRVAVSADNWNELRVAAGRYYCMLCAARGPAGGAEAHTRTARHRTLMRSRPFHSSDSPFIKLDQPEGQLVCVMCQVRVTPPQLDEHSRDPKHTRLRIMMARTLNEDMYFPTDDSE